jgi:galactose mutarotase-like enzyme
MFSSKSSHYLLAAVLSTAILLLVPSAAAQSKGESPMMQPKIGGQPAIVLHRARTGDGGKPEFLSLTVLPGRAMDLFQITAWIPGKGEIPLIHSPSLEEAARILDAPEAPYGTKSFTFGGPFLAPFANRIIGPLSKDGRIVSFTWDGQPMTLDANWKGRKPEAMPHAIHGLMLESAADGVHVSESGDSKIVSGLIHGGDFSGHWFSMSEVAIRVTLERGAVIAAVEVKNVGNKPEPVGIGWHPYFNLPSGDRGQARLYVPGDLRAEVNNYDDVFPTGKLAPVGGTPFDFTQAGGAPLGATFLDDNFSHLKKAADGSSYSEIIDPAAKYGIRITALTAHVNTVQVYAPIDQAFVALEPQFNRNDPFGAEWKDGDSGMVTLAPGQSVTWKVKLELFVP